jgi:hypothetical protein
MEYFLIVLLLLIFMYVFACTSIIYIGMLVTDAERESKPR